MSKPTMTSDHPRDASAAAIAFTMPSLLADHDGTVHSVAVVGATPLDDVVAQAVTSVDAAIERDTASDAAFRSGMLAPPTADTRAEYMYSLAEYEHRQAPTTDVPKVGLLQRLRNRWT